MSSNKEANSKQTEKKSSPPDKKSAPAKSSSPSKAPPPKKVVDINAIRVNEMNFVQFMNHLKSAFPDQASTFNEAEMKKEFERFVKARLPFKYAKQKIEKNLKDEGKVNEQKELILFGSSDQPNKKTAEDGSIEFVEPFKTNVSAYFYETDTFGKVDLKKKDNDLERMGIVWGQKCKASIERQPTKDPKYSDYLWVRKCEGNEEVNVEEILKKFMFYPEYFDESLIYNGNNEPTYPVMVLYGSIGGLYSTKDFVPQDDGKSKQVELAPLLETKDGQTEQPSFTFTLYNKELSTEDSPSTRVVYVALSPQWHGRFFIKFKYGDLTEQIKSYMSDEKITTTDILQALNDFYGGGTMHVFVIGYPRKSEWKNDRLQVNFVATAIIETDYIPSEFPDYDSFMERYNALAQQTPQENTAKSSGDTSKAKMELEKKKIEIQKKKIIKGLEVLGVKATYQDLANANYLPKTDNEGEIQLFERLIAECVKELGNKSDATSSPKEDVKEESEEESAEQELTEEEMAEEDAQVNAEPEKPEEVDEKKEASETKEVKEEQKDEKKEETAPQEIDEELKKVFEKADNNKLGQKTKDVIGFIYNNDEGTGISTDFIVEKMNVKKPMLERVLKQMSDMKILYSPKKDFYSVVL